MQTGKNTKPILFDELNKDETKSASKQLLLDEVIPEKDDIHTLVIEQNEDEAINTVKPRPHEEYNPAKNGKSNGLEKGEPNDKLKPRLSDESKPVKGDEVNLLDELKKDETKTVVEPQPHDDESKPIKNDEVNQPI